jgi:pimeloyl-ACP methyl ester carboxylesterase
MHPDRHVAGFYSPVFPATTRSSKVCGLQAIAIFALPDAEIHLLDAGHFALDEKNDEIASLILAFLAKHSV